MWHCFSFQSNQSPGTFFLMSNGVYKFWHLFRGSRKCITYPCKTKKEASVTAVITPYLNSAMGKLSTSEKKLMNWKYMNWKNMNWAYVGPAHIKVAHIKWYLNNLTATLTFPTWELQLCALLPSPTTYHALPCPGFSLHDPKYFFHPCVNGTPVMERTVLPHVKPALVSNRFWSKIVGKLLKKCWRVLHFHN